MPKKEKKQDLWSEASERYARRKLKELIEEWQNERKSKGLPATRQDLAKELHYGHRNSIRNWLNGDDPIPRQAICNYFKVEPSFFEARNLDELDLMDEKHHQWMQSNVEDMAAEYGVSKSFLWYLKSDQRIQDIIINNQPTDNMLNSFDPEVPDVNSPYQFIQSTGEKAYLNEYTLPILGRIEPKVKEFIEGLLWCEYNRREK